MNNADRKKLIIEALGRFNSGDLTESSLNLFQTLGYNTDRQMPLTHKTFDEFDNVFVSGDPIFSYEKVIKNDWKYVDLLFQLSQEELSSQLSLLDSGEVDKSIIESYLFFVIELSQGNYTRTALSHITREINKLFRMPVMVLFKHGYSLTLAVIERRLHKKDQQKDVLSKVTLIKDIGIDVSAFDSSTFNILEKVTHIKDISTNSPHRAHIDILFDLSFDELVKQYKINNFTDLHNAWQKTLDTKELSKRFYQELSNWYFWAMGKVSFPDDDEKDREIRNATNLIRLITRLIFIWFLKEKDLMPDSLFKPTEIDKILKEFLIKDTSSSSYYRAILQNLFFGTLNQKISSRKFANNSDMDIKDNYLYANEFAIPENHVVEIYKEIPFINGGLFDCLDKTTDAGQCLYVDGYTHDSSKQANVPDYLFFSDEKEIDLNSIYGTKNKKYKVKGLIDILRSYKFTISENTPIEEEIALDPELLGKVFENLLASYNPETKTTARKQTGSYYTPREIVNYMVDESLIYYLRQKIDEDGLEINEDAIRDIFSYSDKPNNFNEKEIIILIRAIDNCKILDPAVGSGAFPMGVLNKLVHILSKLDPQNELWKNRQLEKAYLIEDTVIRERLISDINNAFINNVLDYGRKLYLIENCIYGVDIQPIAIQITKLRFFISLFIDQNKDPKRDNYGISALPNLETKFVSANALVRLGKPEGQLTLFSCKNVDLENIETKLKKLRHDYFNAKSFEDKLDFQKIDRQARGAITQYLCEIGWEDHVVGLISEYDPYDQNTASSFFDPEWMFGLKGGFDILIANPPYVKEYFNRLAFDGLRDSPYYQGKMDLWYMFVSIGIDLLRFNGILTFIVQNNWVTSYGASKMRDKIMYDTQILQLVDFGEFKVFDAGIQTMVMVLKKNSTSDNYVFDYRKLHGSDNISEDLTVLLNKEDYSKAEYLTPMIVRNQFIDSTFSFSHDYIKNILDKISLLSDFKLYDNEVANGIHHHHGYIDKNRSDILEGKFKVGDGIFLLSNKEKDKLLLTNEELDLIKPSYTTKELSRWHANPINKEWVIYTDSSFKNKDKIKKYPNIKNHLDQFRKVITSDNKPYGLHRARDEYFFKGEKIIAVRKCSRPSFTYVDFDSYVSATFYIIKTERISHKYLVGILNSNLIAFWLKHKGKMQGNHYQIDKEPLINLPLIEPEQNTQFEIEKLVNIICLIANEDGYIENQSKQEMVGTYEYQINQIVYKLYNLKQDEIAIVESSA